MIGDLREWLMHCISIDMKKWRTMMQQASFYRKHLILDRDWQPAVDAENKTAWHALSWARMSLDDVDQYNTLLSKVKEARIKFHADRIAKEKVGRKAYKREYMRAYRANKTIDRSVAKTLTAVKDFLAKTHENQSDEP